MWRLCRRMREPPPDTRLYVWAAGTTLSRPAAPTQRRKADYGVICQKILLEIGLEIIGMM